VVVIKTNIINLFFTFFFFNALCVNAQEHSIELSGGINISTNGYGIYFQSCFPKVNSKIKNSITLYSHTIKHAQETRIKNEKYINPSPYVLGKINAGGGFGIDFTFHHQIGSHQDNSPKLFLGASVGPILGIMKPYYVSFDKPGEPNQIIVQNEGILGKQDSIIGSIVWTKGLSELSYTPGIHFDLNFLVQWRNYNRVHNWQNGIRINYFPKGLDILLLANNSSFISFYTQYGFNRKK
jgi:hypothetical protein